MRKRKYSEKSLGTTTVLGDIIDSWRRLESENVDLAWTGDHEWEMKKAERDFGGRVGQKQQNWRVEGTFP